jgi:hypothetical protein
MATFQKALKLRMAALGENHPDVADVHCYIGDLFTTLGKLADAEITYKRVIDVFEASCSNTIALVGVSRCHARLAEIYNRTDRPQFARVAANKAMLVLQLYQRREQDAYREACRYATPLY